jgi:hypothetical protein
VDSIKLMQTRGISKDGSTGSKKLGIFLRSRVAKKNKESPVELIIIGTKR